MPASPLILSTLYLTAVRNAAAAAAFLDRMDAPPWRKNQLAYCGATGALVQMFGNRDPDTAERIALADYMHQRGFTDAPRETFDALIDTCMADADLHFTPDGCTLALAMPSAMVHRLALDGRAAARFAFTCTSVASRILGARP